MQASHFNRSVGLWEPLIEPAQVMLEVRQPPRPELGAAAAAVEARISMISRLELVLSDDAVNALCAVSARVQEAFTAPLPLLLAQRTRSPHAIVNETGVELFYWQAVDVPRGITRHRIGKPAEAKRILPGQEEPLELWSSDAVQQKAQLIQIEIEGAAPLAPSPLMTAHAVDAARVGLRLVPLKPAAAPGMPRGGDEMDALVCSVELKDGGATTLLRLGTLVQAHAPTACRLCPPHTTTHAHRLFPPPAYLSPRRLSPLASAPLQVRNCCGLPLELQLRVPDLSDSASRRSSESHSRHASFKPPQPAAAAAAATAAAAAAAMPPPPPPPPPGSSTARWRPAAHEASWGAPARGAVTQLEPSATLSVPVDFLGAALLLRPKEGAGLGGGGVGGGGGDGDGDGKSRASSDPSPAPPLSDRFHWPEGGSVLPLPSLLSVRRTRQHLRVAARVRRRFGLPETEEVLEHYWCKLLLRSRGRARRVVRGSLYITSKSVCVSYGVRQRNLSGVSRRSEIVREIVPLAARHVATRRLGEVTARPAALSLRDSMALGCPRHFGAVPQPS